MQSHPTVQWLPICIQDSLWLMDSSCFGLTSIFTELWEILWTVQIFWHLSGNLVASVCFFCSACLRCLEPTRANYFASYLRKFLFAIQVKEKLVSNLLFRTPLPKWSALACNIGWILHMSLWQFQFSRYVIRDLEDVCTGDLWSLSPNKRHSS